MRPVGLPRATGVFAPLLATRAGAGSNRGVAPVAAYGVAFSAVSGLALAAALLMPALPARRTAVVVGLAAAVLGVAAVMHARSWEAAILIDAALLVGAAAAGGAIGGGIDQPGHLLPVAWVSALTDAASVLYRMGPSALIAAKPRVLSLLALSFPLIGSGRIEPILGFGDVLFCAVYVAAARRHGLDLRRMIVALGAGLLATLGLVIAFETAVPALPLMGAFVILLFPAARSIPAADRRVSVAAMAVVTVAVTVLLLVG
jgi:hypothetical protein